MLACCVCCARQLPRSRLLLPPQPQRKVHWPEGRCCRLLCLPAQGVASEQRALTRLQVWQRLLLCPLCPLHPPCSLCALCLLSRPR